MTEAFTSLLRVVPDMEWIEDGLCRGRDDLDFYPEAPARRHAPPMPIEVARLCARCPVRLQCQAYAIPNEMYGIWGGLTEVDRAAMRRKLVRPVTRRMSHHPRRSIDPNDPVARKREAGRLRKAASRARASQARRFLHAHAASTEGEQ